MVSKDIREIQHTLREYEETALIAGVKFRLELSEILIRGLRRKRWTLRELAKRTGLTESYISSVLHSNRNCSFKAAGNMLFALGIRASIVVTKPGEEEKEKR